MYVFASQPGPKRPQEPQQISSTSENKSKGPKKSLRGEKRPQRSLQEQPKRPQEGTKRCQRGCKSVPRVLQEVHKRLQEESKKLLRGPSECPKRPPTKFQRLQECPRRPLGPSPLQVAPKSTQKLPRWLKRSTQELPRSTVKKIKIIGT